MSTRGVVKAGPAFFSFIFDAHPVEHKYLLTLKNDSTKKFICQRHPVETEHYFNRLEREEAMDKVRERVIELIKDSYSELLSVKQPNFLP